MASIFDAFRPKFGAVFVFPEPNLASGGFEEFAVDVTTAINTTMTASVTQFPVEGRETITDHVQAQPLTMSIDGFISESPSGQLLTALNSIRSAVIQSANLPGLVGTVASAATGALVSKAFNSTEAPATDASYVKLLTTRDAVDPNFPKRAMIGLIRMFEKGVPFTMRTFFNDSVYKDMIMTSLTFKQTTKEGNSLSFSMSCKKITITSVFTDKASEFKMLNPAGQSASEKKVNTKATKKKNKSGLFKLLKSVGGTS